jgi:HAMP domain-containing protein
MVALFLTACGESAERSLCASYEQFLEAGEVIRSVDPESETAAEAIDEIEEFQSSVAQLRETTDGRFRSAVDDLDAAVADVLRTLQGVDPDEDYSTWAPLVADDVETAQAAAAYVVELIAPQCAPTEES